MDRLIEPRRLSCPKCFSEFITRANDVTPHPRNLMFVFRCQTCGGLSTLRIIAKGDETHIEWEGGQEPWTQRNAAN